MHPSGRNGSAQQFQAYSPVKNGVEIFFCFVRPSTLNGARERRAGDTHSLRHPQTKKAYLRPSRYDRRRHHAV